MCGMDMVGCRRFELEEIVGNGLGWFEPCVSVARVGAGRDGALRRTDEGSSPEDRRCAQCRE